MNITIGTQKLDLPIQKCEQYIAQQIPQDPTTNSETINSDFLSFLKKKKTKKQEL